MRNDPLIPNIAVVTDIRVDTPDVKTFRVVGLDGKKPFVHIPGQCAMQNPTYCTLSPWLVSYAGRWVWALPLFALRYCMMSWKIPSTLSRISSSISARR